MPPGDGPAPPHDGPAPVPDGGVTGTLMFDSAGDFSATGAILQSMTIEARGSLTPDAYTYGGLLARGYPGQKLWTHTNPTWAALDGKTPAGSGMWQGERITDQDGFLNSLDFLGITDITKMSVAFEGEVWLEVDSNEKFLLSGNDIAFFQIAPPGTTQFSPVSDANGIPVTVQTPVTGWYPIRVGHTNFDEGNDLDFTHSEKSGSMQTWTRDRMRARTSALTGTLQTVFGHQILGGGQGLSQEEVLPISSLVTTDLLTTDLTPQPQGSGTDDFSVRYAGQIYIAQAGSYTLTITSDAGNLGLLRSARGGSHFVRDDGIGTSTPITTNLDPGWNDLCVDYNHVKNGKSLQIQIAGPDFASGAIPQDHLRPVESNDDRLAFGSEDMDRVIGDNGGPTRAASADLKVDGSAGETVTAIDVTFQLNAKFGPEIKADLETPQGRRVPIRDNDPSTPSGEQFLQVRVPAGSVGQLGQLLGGPVAGTWKLHVYDTDNAGTAGTSTLESVRLTLHTTGGPEKIAKTASWTSQVIDQPTDVFAIDRITTDERVPPGTALAVFVRTCQQASCSDGSWMGPVAKDTAFNVPPGRHLQLRVDMTSDGVHEPELRSLAVALRRNA